MLKTPALKSHVERHRHEKERKHELGDAVVKLEKLSSTSEKLAIDKTVTEKFDKISVIVDKHEKAGPSNSSLCANPMDKIEKVEKTTDSKRHRNFQRKSTPSENSNDAVHFEAPSQQTAPTLSSTTESSSASNSPKPRPRKRKIIDDPVEAFQNTPTACRIIVEPSEIVIRDPSSPPPLALLSKGFVLFFIGLWQELNFLLISVATIIQSLNHSRLFGLSLLHRQLSSSMEALL